MSAFSKTPPQPFPRTGRSPIDEAAAVHVAFATRAGVDQVHLPVFYREMVVDRRDEGAAGGIITVLAVNRFTLQCESTIPVAPTVSPNGTVVDRRWGGGESLLTLLARYRTSD